jgi:signal transduction histidine kinase
MTIVYSFIRYIYSREIIYISHGFMQMFSLVFIVAYSKLFVISILIQDIALLLATISAVVFAIAFYEGNFFPKISNFKELLLNTIFLNMVILSAIYHYLLFEYLPYTIIYAILFISIIFNLKKGFSPVLIYVIGWTIFCFLLFIFDFQSYYTTIGFIDIVLVAFAVEAMLFTLSMAYKYNSLQIQSKSYENMLLHQSRLAKSGEMIGNITHQFRQPLNNLSYILINLKKRYEKEKLDQVYFDKKVTQANEQINFLSKTIEDFKDFYAPSKHKENFKIKESIEASITILSAELKRKDIKLNFDINTDENIQLYGIKNELSQVILTLISNSSEALTNCEDPYIKIKLSSNSAESIVCIEDNGGGIKNKYLDKIFEPYFSTKEKGSGIGLYLAKLIVEESFDSRILFENTTQGVKFTLYFEKTI